MILLLTRYSTISVSILGAGGLIEYPLVGGHIGDKSIIM
jgi:hypothetical protein